MSRPEIISREMKRSGTKAAQERPIKRPTPASATLLSEVVKDEDWSPDEAETCFLGRRNPAHQRLLKRTEVIQDDGESRLQRVKGSVWHRYSQHFNEVESFALQLNMVWSDMERFFGTPGNDEYRFKEDVALPHHHKTMDVDFGEWYFRDRKTGAVFCIRHYKFDIGDPIDYPIYRDKVNWLVYHLKRETGAVRAALERHTGVQPKKEPWDLGHTFRLPPIRGPGVESRQETEDASTATPAHGHDFHCHSCKIATRRARKLINCPHCDRKGLQGRKGLLDHCRAKKHTASTGRTLAHSDEGCSVDSHESSDDSIELGDDSDDDDGPGCGYGYGGGDDSDSDDSFMHGECGFSGADVFELMCQGVKPWDDDARAVLAALSY